MVVDKSMGGMGLIVKKETDLWLIEKGIKTMSIDLQPVLQNENIILYPLQAEDFTAVYAAASDPEVWAQHPNKDRWREEVFSTFFEGAMKSCGAFRIVDKATGATLGSTRFYNYNAEDNSIFIGYTFYARACWGKGINPGVKKMMLDYIFQFVDRVGFHIGAQNIRSQIAIGRLGAVKTGEEVVNYYGEAPKHNFVYEITKEAWHQA